MSFQNPEDVVHIIVTTNTAAIAAVLTATATSWLFIGKPDLGMTINGWLSGWPCRYHRQLCLCKRFKFADHRGHSRYYRRIRRNNI